MCSSSVDLLSLGGELELCGKERGRRYDVARLGEDDARSIDDIPIEQVVINQVVVLALRADDLYRLCERSRKEGFTPMPGLVAQARRHRRKSLILPSVSARRSESFIKKCAARPGNVPKSEARRETAQTEGRAHEPQGGEVTERGRDRRLRHARRRRRHVRGVTDSSVPLFYRGETHFWPCSGWTLGGSLWITMQKRQNSNRNHILCVKIKNNPYFYTILHVLHGKNAVVIA